ncbi:Protein-l-isoaspartate O-methyltransferase [Phytophthora pseudosyringae]|uniref:Protein-l-isoaspartate O-methyltransferase n=1 Tax=Phytophthora pseudosyringae TaxID=221518 RepID=A0A8T1WAK0_9STRA|nr:Protein-l-isoaspartate O-methyltransferase [Phytophthora pseudosyringae]
MSFWPCNSSSNDGLVQNLKRTGVISSESVFNAMAKTDRAKYLSQIETPDGGHVGKLQAYQDVPHPIGYHQTISAPHMHGHAMELGYAAIKDVRDPRILDVGAGSGYLTACLGRMVEGRGGHVFGLEIVPGLVQFAKKNIQMADGDLVDRGIVSVRCHNGWDGLPNEAPFHYIHVGAAAEAPPQALMDQLADGGRLVLPLDEARGGQVFVEITRHGTNYSQRRLFGVCYVPLIRERERKLS